MRRVRPAFIAAAFAALTSAPGLAAVGDCSGSGQVRISDVITAVNVALGDTPLEACRSVDADGDGAVAVNELITAVLYALGVLPGDGGERCGNAGVDPTEQCDDGNLYDRDGCDSSCRLEGIGVLDQRWLGYRGSNCGGFTSGGNVGLLGPFAQEFVPQLSAVTSVLVDAESAAAGQASALRLNIRRATFDGRLLAWTSTLVLHPPTSTRQNWVRFDLPVPLAVTPGEVYVLELVGYDNGLILISSGGDLSCDEREYVPGDLVTHGERTEGADLLFGIFGTDAPGVGAVDQAWYGPQGICGTNGGGGYLGDHTLTQTFTPTTDALGAVAVDLGAVSGTAIPSGTLTLRLREGGRGGTILATVQRFLTAPTQGEAWYVFTLSPPISVTPGATYAIELSDETQRFVWYSAMGDASPPGCTERELPGGEAFVDDTPIHSDFPFATFAPIAAAPSSARLGN